MSFSAMFGRLLEITEDIYPCVSHCFLSVWVSMREVQLELYCISPNSGVLLRATGSGVL